MLSFVDFVTITRELDDAEALLGHIRSLPIEDFLYYELNTDFPRDVIETTLREPTSASALVGRLSYFSRMPAQDLVALFTDPHAFREELLYYISANRTDNFESRIKELTGRYAERSKAIEARLALKAPLALAEELKKRPFPKRDFHRYYFIPSYFIGRMDITSFVDDSFLFAFNIDPGSDGAANVSVDLSERLRVLSDRSRLEILRVLSQGASYGKELSNRLSLTTATVSRHLDQLKSAGFVVEDQPNSQNMKLSRIDHEAIETLLEDVLRYLRCDPFPCHMNQGDASEAPRE